ncbi:MAG: acyl-CoA synthetase [Raineya sp.]
MWIARSKNFSSKIALSDAQGAVSYQEIWQEAQKVASFLLRHFQSEHLQERRIAFLCQASRRYVALQWGIWLSGGIAVPIATSHPRHEIDYVLQDADCSLIFTENEFLDLLQNLPIPFFTYEQIANAALLALPAISSWQKALIIYTSGTTGKPKGVVTSHHNIESQISTLVEAWQWTAQDRILHVLPLHHIHGIINALACALYAGAEVVFLPKFDAAQVWNKWLMENFTIFMAVPTIYNRLITYWENANPQEQEKMYQACQKMRLMISGSAALPVSVLEKWQRISGHCLLERYGMSEIGMAISNPLQGKRKAGMVGLPLPKVQVRLVDETGQEVKKGEIGEIQVKSESVFVEYWRKPEATAESFTIDGWFKTGDTAQQDQEGYFKILGRTSTDILKTGGYKVSAIEIEETLRQHPYIADCAVVGIPDEEWGEKVTAFVILQPEKKLNLQELRTWAKNFLAHYKIPTQLQIVGDFPRNAMGKVIKKQLIAEISNF